MATPIQSVDRDAAAAATGAPARASVRRWLARVLPAALALAGWWKLREQLYHVHWGRGPTIFLLLVASIALVLAVPRLARLLARTDAGDAASRRAAADGESARIEGGGRASGSAATAPAGSGWRVAAALAVVALVATVDDVTELRRGLAAEAPELLDVGAATWAAGFLFVERGENPYTTRLQPHQVTGGRGVERTARGVEIFGVPYHYGFAYFPAMFLSYLPFRLYDVGPSSIRVGNAFLLVAALAAGSWLAWRLAPAERRRPAAALAAVLLLTTTGLGNQLFHFGVTDLVIPVFVLFALVASSYRRHFLAGCLMGLAFSAKLLPAALFALVFFCWLAPRGGLRRALVGFVLVTAAVLLPFVAWNPGAFVSATFLFYMTHHAAGDTTSLWYYLPPALRGPFQATGGLLTLAVAASVLWSKSGDERDLLRAMVLATLVSLAFSPMIHLNYQFAVVPLACVALAADAMGEHAATPRARRRRVAAAATPS